MKQLTKKELKGLVVELTKNGFTIWSAPRGTKNRRWLLDGSCLKEDGEIRLGNPDFHDEPLKVIYSADTNSISFIKKD